MIIWRGDSLDLRPRVIKGGVVSIMDGDTFDVSGPSGIVRIRIWGIDAPEHGQRFGDLSTAFLSKLILGKEVICWISTYEKWRRGVARVDCETGTDVGGAMITRGLAWWYRRFAGKDIWYKALESAARGARLGLWIDERPIPPWVFRRSHKW